MLTYSLVTPSLNQVQFISKTLDSVESQIIQPIEHIIYDGGSTDGTLDKLEQYILRNQRAILHIGEDNGQTNAINLGFLKASGDIISWLNTDDYFYDKETVKRVLLAFEKYPEIDLLVGGGTYVNEKFEHLKKAYIHDPNNFSKSSFAYSVGILQPSVFMRRQVFEKTGHLNEDYSFSFDFEYWIRVASLGFKFGFIDRPFSSAVIHSDAKTMQYREKSLREAIEICQNHFGFVSYDWCFRYADHKKNKNDGIIKLEKKLNPELEDYARLYFNHFNFLNEFSNFSKHIKSGEHNKTSELFKKYLDIQTTLIFCTTFDKHYFDQGLTLISSIIRTSKLDPIIFVFDLGLAENQLQLLRSVTQVKILYFPENKSEFFDGYFDPKNYVYKTYIFYFLNKFLPENLNIIFLDAGVCINKSVKNISNKIEKDHVFFIDHSDKKTDGFPNVLFTSSSCLKYMDVSLNEAMASHIRSSVVGFKTGGKYQRLFEEAFFYSKNRDVSLGEKHPKNPINPASNFASLLEKFRGSLEVGDKDKSNKIDWQKFQSLSGYWGHRQDQSIISILVSRYKIKISLANEFCFSDNESSSKSRKNHLSGKVYKPWEGKYTKPSYLSKFESDLVQHRGLYRNFEFLFKNRLQRYDKALVMGNGPSLKKFEFEKKNEYLCSIGMNVAYRYWEKIGFYPQIYCCLDIVVGNSHKKQISNLIKNSQFLGIELFLLRDELIRHLNIEENFDRVVNFDLIRSGIGILNVEPITTGSHSLAFASLFQFEEIGILGVDLNYKEMVEGAKLTSKNTLKIEKQTRNPNYFFQGYQQNGDEYNVPNPSKDLHLRSWLSVKENLADGKAKIFNLAKGSKFNLFNSISLNEFLKNKIAIKKTVYPKKFNRNVASLDINVPKNFFSNGEIIFLMVSKALEKFYGEASQQTLIECFGSISPIKEDFLLSGRETFCFKEGRKEDFDYENSKLSIENVLRFNVLGTLTKKIHERAMERGSQNLIVASFVRKENQFVILSKMMKDLEHQFPVIFLKTNPSEYDLDEFNFKMYKFIQDSSINGYFIFKLENIFSKKNSSLKNLKINYRETEKFLCNFDQPILLVRKEYSKLIDLNFEEFLFSEANIRVKLLNLSNVFEQNQLKHEIGNVSMPISSQKFCKSSVAQQGEDLILDRIFTRTLGYDFKKPGFYVDAGAYHPVEHSLTYLLYLRGWKGVVFEPSSEAKQAFKLWRSRDTFVHAVVGREDDIWVDFFVSNNANKDMHLTNTKYPGDPIGYKRQNFRQLNLSDELKRRHISEIDLLNLDIEGAEMEVLETFDFERFRPKVISIEIHNNSLEEALKSKEAVLLKELGYICVANAVITFFFVRSTLISK